MEIEKRIREDFWKAIQAHYERGDYTEAVRDTIFFVSNLLRELSGIEDRDGTKLVDAALSGVSPAVLVNRYETTTEKDIQQGIAFSLKGIMQCVRNPLSHEKIEYTQEQAEAIILFVDFLLRQIDQSGGTRKIQDIKQLLYDKDFTASEEYAELLLKEIPRKKRYTLLLELYKDRENLQQFKLSCFINRLIESLTKAERGDFIRTVSSSLMICKDDQELRMYFHYFMQDTYNEVDRLAKLRVEDFIKKSIANGKFEELPWGKDVNESGSLSTWTASYLDMFECRETLHSMLFSKLAHGKPEEEDFVLYYFSRFIFDGSKSLRPWEIELIKKKVRENDSRYYRYLYYIMDDPEPSEWKEIFKDEYEASPLKEKVEALLPF